MSLQAFGPMQTFAHRMYRLWCVWDNAGNYQQQAGAVAVARGYAGPAATAPPPPPPPPGPPPGLARAAAPRAQAPNPQAPANVAAVRDTLLRSAVNAATNFMPRLPLVYTALPAGVWGRFQPAAWQLELNALIRAVPIINYQTFLEICSTVYHEARHAEQHYRIAQGVAGGILQFPGDIDANVLRRLPPVNGVQATRNRLSLAGPIGNRVLTPALLGALLEMPIDIMRRALPTARQDFFGYMRLGRANWFTQRSVQREVEVWMRSAHTYTGRHAQYLQDPLEQDAFAIEAEINRLIVQRIGVAPPANNPIFRNDARFAHLPNT